MAASGTRSRSHVSVKNIKLHSQNSLLCLTSAVSLSILLSSDLMLPITTDGRYGLYVLLCSSSDCFPFLTALYHSPLLLLGILSWSFPSVTPWQLAARSVGRICKQRLGCDCEAIFSAGIGNASIVYNSLSIFPLQTYTNVRRFG